MNFNLELAKFLNVGYDLIVPGEVSAGILLFSVIFYISWSRKIAGTQSLLDHLKSHLAKTNTNGLDALNTVISETQDPKIKSLLYETRDNLIEVEGDLGTEYYSLKSYSDIWTARGLLTGRMNLSLFETMPNILIGAGLMFTFMFLAWALADAGGAMGVGSAEAKSKAMESLIANAGGKFTSSIVGLFCSLTWSWRAKVLLEKLQSAMNEVHAALRKVAPDTAAQAIVRRQHSVFKEMLAESREQVGQLKRFETDIAVAIAKAIGNELQPAFKTLGTELVQAIQLLTDRIGNMNEDALQKMISQFIEEFRGTSSAEMQEFKTVLTQLAKNLEAAGSKIGADLGAAGTTFGSAAGNLETAITKTQETVKQLDSSLQRAGEVVSEGSDRFEIISDKLFTNLRAVDGILVGVDAFIEKIQKNIGTLNDISDSLDDTVEAQKVISIEFRDAIPKMSKALSDAVLEISQSSQTAAESLASIRTELENTKGSIDQTVVSLSSGVDQYTEKVKELHLVLDEKIGEAISKIGTAVMDLTETIDDLVEALPKK
jgi:ABC-type transporter Mla subunit MlaD